MCKPSTGLKPTETMSRSTAARQSTWSEPPSNPSWPSSIQRTSRESIAPVRSTWRKSASCAPGRTANTASFFQRERTGLDPALRICHARTLPATPVSCPVHNRRFRMRTLRPESPEQLAQSLREAAAAKQTIRLGGNFSKDRLGGPPQPADMSISTRSMNRLLQYDPRDLTVSVQPGLPFAELERALAEHRQMLPLDPGWGENSTVGGVVG